MLKASFQISVVVFRAHSPGSWEAEPGGLSLRQAWETYEFQPSTGHVEKLSQKQTNIFCRYPVSIINYTASCYDKIPGKQS